MRKQDKYILWPTYFDQNRTRKEGRKIPKNQAQPAPRLDELQKAAQKLGLNPETIPELAYPAVPWQKTGMITVAKKGSKLQIMRAVAKELATMRAKMPT
jgi:signal recognition particle subunit SRP19